METIKILNEHQQSVYDSLLKKACTTLKKPPFYSGFLTKEESAKVFNLSPETMRVYQAKGKLPRFQKLCNESVLSIHELAILYSKKMHDKSHLLKSNLKEAS